MAENEPAAPPAEIDEGDLEKVVGGLAKVRSRRPTRRPVFNLVDAAEQWLSAEGVSDQEVEQYSKPGS